jgi:hypothetical protein
MAPAEQLDSTLQDCFLAVGQAIGTAMVLDPAALVWWRSRYGQAFVHAMRETPDAWSADRDRVVAVSRFLGLRALHHAGDSRTIDLKSAMRASTDVEAGCQMRRRAMRRA